MKKRLSKSLPGIVLSGICAILSGIEPPAGGWILPGKNPVETVNFSLKNLPGKYLRVEADIEVADPDESTCDVFRLRLEQPGRKVTEPITVPIVSPVGKKRTLVLEPFFEADPGLSLNLRLERENQDPRNTWHGETRISTLRAIPLAAPTGNRTVQSCPGYNSWSFIQSSGGKLVCVYSRGSAHTIDEPARGVYARTSSDGGKTWTEETLVCNSPDCGEVPIGKGTDQQGNMLFWVRCAGKNWHHELYRTADGIHFRRIAVIKPDPMPIQITDILSVPEVGLMSLWFSGSYRASPKNSWGTLVSRDNGLTWKQNVIESGLKKTDWPTEQSAVYVGEGRILAIARCEGGVKNSTRAQFQLESTDYGRTWKRFRTNITDVLESTPSLIYDRSSGQVFNYYFQRGTGQLKCRAAPLKSIWNHPMVWPAPQVTATASKMWHHAGNVNAAVYGNQHCLTFYSGDERNTSVLIKLIQPNPDQIMRK